MQSEVTVILKGEDSTFRKQFNCYEEISISSECSSLRKMIEQTKKEFKGVPDEIQLRVHVEWLEG